MTEDPGIPQVDGPPKAWCNSGEVYEVLTSSGLKAEGCELSGMFTSEAAAWRAYNMELRRYVGEHLESGAFIIWRSRPDCGEVDFWYQKDISMRQESTPRKLYAVYSRLVVTAKSQAEPSE